MLCVVVHLTVGVHVIELTKCGLAFQTGPG